MKTELIDILKIDKAVTALKQGLPVVFPTETVYGLGAPVFHVPTIDKVFKIKGRPSDNPLIVHISKLSMAEELSRELKENFYKLAGAFWPGPLTIVVAKSEKVPPIVSGNLPTVAIRMPSHKVALQLIDELNEPLVGPSANISGRPSPTTVFDSLEDLDGLVPYAINGGDCEIGIESTVISLFHSQPTILRHGKISKEEIEEVLGVEILNPPEHGPAYSPGMKYRHYAPKAKVTLVYKQENLKDDFVYPSMKNLYAELRKADRKGKSEVQLYCDAHVLENPALMNRILKASGQI